MVLQQMGAAFSCNGRAFLLLPEIIPHQLRQVAEVRGAEVFDMLQAMSTGHDGSLTTLHANNPRDSMARLEMMMMLAGSSIPQRAMRQQIAASLDIMVHLSRLSDGSRKIVKISEICGMEGETVTMQDLFEFVPNAGFGAGRITGSFGFTGVRPSHLQRIEAAGFKIEQKIARAAGY